MVGSVWSIAILCRRDNRCITSHGEAELSVPVLHQKLWVLGIHLLSRRPGGVAGPLRVSVSLSGVTTSPYGCEYSLRVLAVQTLAWVSASHWREHVFQGWDVGYSVTSECGSLNTSEPFSRGCHFPSQGNTKQNSIQSLIPLELPLPYTCKGQDPSKG